MIQQALPRSTSKGLFEVRTSQPCPVHQAHLITTTKYNLGGNKAHKRRLNQLNELYENHLATVDQTVLIHQQRSNWREGFKPSVQIIRTMD